ncbi:MAG: PIN domain-containing protein [Solirubrobacteraceae bacterium]
MSDVLRRVEGGERLTVTADRRSVAELVPLRRRGRRVRALHDTSFFVATESGRRLGQMRGVIEAEDSVVSLAELTVGVLLANDAERARRVATLTAVESWWDPLPIDAELARAFARIVAGSRAGRRRIPNLDALVAATAVVERMPVVAPDRGYAAIPDVEVISV